MIGFIVFGQSETHLVSCMWFAQGVSVKDLRVSFVEGGFQQRQRRTWRTEWPIQICKNLEQKWRYWGALWCFRIFGSVRASYSAWPEGICFLSNAIKGIANTFLKLFKQNFTWNDCARMVFFKSTVADRSIVFLHWHCGHGVQLLSKDHRTFKTMIYNNRYGTMFLQGFVPLPGFACRLSCLPERKAGPACSSVTKKAEADWERITCAQCSRCFSTAIYDILWHHLSVLSKTVNKWVKGCIACRGRPAPQTTLFRHAFWGIAGIADWSIDPSMMGTVWLLSLALRCYSTLIQVFMRLISIHLPWRPSALKVRKEKNWTRIRAVIANWCKVDRKLNFKPRWRKVLQDSSSSEALFFIVCMMCFDKRWTLETALAVGMGRTDSTQETWPKIKYWNYRKTSLQYLYSVAYRCPGADKWSCCCYNRSCWQRTERNCCFTGQSYRRRDTWVQGSKPDKFSSKICIYHQLSFMQDDTGTFTWKSRIKRSQRFPG